MLTLYKRLLWGLSCPACSGRECKPGRKALWCKDNIARVSFEGKIYRVLEKTQSCGESLRKISQRR